MSMVDFNQEAKDPGCLHIALTTLGGGSNGLLKAVSKVVRQMAPVQLSEPKGTVLFLRFLDGEQLPCWAAGRGTKVRVRWDQYSAHKSVLGLLCVAHCQGPEDLETIRTAYKELRETHKDGLCSWRCLIYGPRKRLPPDTELRDGMIHIDSLLDELDVHVDDIRPLIVEKVASELAQSIFKSLKTRMEECYRVVNDPSRTDPLPLLRAPVDTSDDESERQLSRAHLLGRLQKQLADLYLLIGQLHQAGRWYRTAWEELKHHKDWLWIGGACEGLSVTAIMTKECEQVLGQKAQGVDSPSALQAILKGKYNTPKGGSRTPGSQNSTGSVITNRATTMDPRRATTRGTPTTDPSLSRMARSATTKRPTAKSPSPTDMDPQDESSASPSLVISNNVQVPSFLEDEDEEEEVDEEETELNKDEDNTLSLLIDRRLLHKDFIVDKFVLAQVNFRKAGKRGSVVHMESLLKFSKYLVEQKLLGKAAETLQKVLRLDCSSPSDQLTLYQTLASIYESMGFHRKAAMFTLYAARHANKIAKNQSQQIHQAHSLLVSSLPGYRLSPDLETLPSTTASHDGWPKLQASVLADFVYLSRKLGEDVTVIKHACYLLEMLHKHMETRDLKGITFTLEQVIKEARDRCVKPSYASSVAGKLVSPIPLTHFPSVRSFYPRPLIRIMAPLRRVGFTPKAPLVGKELDVTGGGGGTNPFIYSPFGVGKKKNGVKREEVLWVQGDPAEMAISIYNPLPFELRVENMALIMEGSGIEIFPSSLTLPGGAEQSQFALVSIPHETGVVTVQGYEATVFGVHHQCEVKTPGDPLIRVIPKMPLLRVKSFPAGSVGKREEDRKGGAGGRRLSKASVERFELMDGESCKFRFEFQSDEKVVLLKAIISKQDNNHCQFSWDEADIANMLPLSPDVPRSFSITIRACIPSSSRLITPSASGPKTNEIREVLALPVDAIPLRDLAAPFTSFSGRATPSDDYTPNSSPVIKRGWRRKVSNDDGLIRPERGGSSSLVDSLHLDPPLLSNSSTLPNLGRASPGSANKYNSILRQKKKGAGYMKPSGLSYNDVIFGLDKRASIRSDPGDRDQGERGKSRPKPRVGGSSHTSPTSSISTLSSDATQPISIPHTASHLVAAAHEISSHSPVFKVGSDSLVRAHPHQSLARNASLQPRIAKPGLVKGNISSPKGPLYKEVATKQRVMTEFLLEYSGEAGAAEGYYRVAEATVYVTVNTCLLFEQFDISNSETSQELFHLNFVIHNVSSSQQLKVTCKVEQEGLLERGGTAELMETIEPTSTWRCSLLIRKFNLETDSTISPGTKTDIHRSKQYSKRLLEMLTICWEVVGGAGTGRQGTLSLEGIPLPAASIPIMRPPSILFSVTLDGHHYSPMESTHSRNLSLGSLVSALIKVTNNSTAAMAASFLVLEPYTFSQEGRSIVRNLSGKMLYSGSLVTSIPKLSPGASFEHQVSMSFLYRGHYLVDIKIITPTQHKDTPTSSSRPQHAGTSKSPARRAWQERSKPPDLSSLPPTSAPGPTSPPIPSSTATSPPPPPTRPKSARALARKFEMDFNSKKTEPPSPQLNSATVSQSTTATTVTSESDTAKPTSGEVPPPVPTSSRPAINRTLSYQLGQVTSPVVDKNLSRVYTMHNNKHTALAKPVPISPAQSSVAGSSKTASTSKHSLSSSRSAVLLPSQSKYQSLVRERTQTSGSVKTISGPNFSFYVS